MERQALGDMEAVLPGIKMGYCKLLKGMEALSAFYSLIMLPHNFKWLADPIQNMLTLWEMGNRVIGGEIKVFGLYDESEKLVGIQHGIFLGNDFYNHVFLIRHCKDSINLAKKAIKELKKNFPETKRIIGTVPENNKGSRIYALRCGFENKGASDDLVFRQEGKVHKVLIFEKEI